MGSIDRASKAYRALIDEHNATGEVHLYLACCYFLLQMNDEADEQANKGPTCPLKNRLLFHLAHRKNDESKLMMYLQVLTDEREDQLSLAAMHYLRKIGRAHV